MSFGGFRSMWVLTMFDLPTDTRQARKDYHDFRQGLLKDGFRMMQYSVYARHAPSQERAVIHEKRVQANLPPDGEVRIIRITDKQFEKMKVFYGKMRKAEKKAPEQITLF